MSSGTVCILRGLAALTERPDWRRIEIPEGARFEMIDAMVHVFGPNVMDRDVDISDEELPLFFGLAAEVLEAEE